ncbi:MAG: DUF5690 family protein [Cytophagaceae bacterium]|nr:DUF5690 family protein [Cytophagaceae bacterium]
MLTQTLQRRPSWVLTVYLTTAAFVCYFCLYAFRRPVTAGTFEGLSLWGVDYKIILVIAQVFGYATSKGLGIRIISETKPHQRAGRILLLVGMAELALLGFALVPPPYNWPFLFFNGLPLGLGYGLVFGFLEGRRVTDLLGAGLCMSFIVASGVAKSVGRWLIVDVGLSEFWMPVVAGLLFVPPLLGAVWMLKNAPPPSAADEAARAPRVPMTAASRRKFFWSLAPGLVALVVVYVLVSILRDVRDNFAVEIWRELGVTNSSIFTISETWVGVIVTTLVGLLFLIKDNRRAFYVNLLFIGIGTLMVPLVTWAFGQGWLSPLGWMVGVGLGIYLAYVPYNGMLFDRMIALLPDRANVGFVLYVADFAGYLGSVAILLVKNFGNAEVSWLQFYTVFAYAAPLLSIVMLAYAGVYFRRKLAR